MQFLLYVCTLLLDSYCITHCASLLYRVLPQKVALAVKLIAAKILLYLVILRFPYAYDLLLLRITTVKSRYVELSRATKVFSREQEFDIARVASNFTQNIFIVDSYMLKHRVYT